MLAHKLLGLAATTLAALPALSPAIPAAGGGPDCARRALGDLSPGFDEFHREIFFAVLEGLYSDGVSSEVVAAIVERDPESGYQRNFVQGCPICTPALDAFRTYLSRPLFTSKVQVDTFGPGLGQVARADLTAPAGAVRRAALQGLIQRWVEARLQRQRLDESERARWRQAMEERSKQGMGRLERLQQSGVGSYDGFETCPLCQGASDATQPR